MEYPIHIPKDELKTFYLNGLSGRALHLPVQPKQGKRTIVLIYGHHPSIERMYTTAQFLNDFGSVYMFDLPGYGGMDSFYHIGREPTLDNYADYLYTMLKHYEPDQKLTIVGLSFGFLIFTRMLQRHPRMADRVELLIGFVGFVRNPDFRFKPRWLSINACRAMSTWAGAGIIKLLVFNKFSLNTMLSLFFKINPKMKPIDYSDRSAVRQMETDLWLLNDLRTHFATTAIMLEVDISHGKHINLPVYNITTDTDQYFDANQVALTMERVYKSYAGFPMQSHAHAPSIMGSKEEVAAMIPKGIAELLKS